MTQWSFSLLEFSGKKNQTSGMSFSPRSRRQCRGTCWRHRSESHYTKTGPQGGRRPFPLSMMLRLYCLQRWHSLSELGAKATPCVMHWI